MTTRTDTNKTQLRVSVATADYDTASQLFHELGMDMTTAINLFLKQSIAVNGLPFRPHLITDTDKAIREAYSDQVQHFNNEADWQSSVHHELNKSD
ncbi:MULTISPECIES: type II toxin-antitoxin system RelB/DinJ family antitoxin [Lactiplantibacillus]|jgi:DNA-damage-inducible protein J|uniref:Type II toxin-antitoxin system RelB/DinJ family antitoxin n=1 Tax=Lactiplantibacillus pentosus TaxID=1589 RepID=A0AAW5PRK2_LACPE|nr:MULTISPECIES: type II toxin-antitoxin system RelB/DinJ family antitoxin [Lactiplantibacillus]AYG39114.1 type II toxin-antitoxin system RelB/DinJ family antitoxin [Lactiplantibacillus pentosus]AYG41773.1 type II toxin-antitoxin system RelB/DinJ family antitoxin [Lactiplantibacillus pentosus]MBU7460459.1 type II toxin-antitoxin system RelB/DinJ family antitoxin [Lactiplantibacillus pentosus]MBU7474792.1 type II toxin-antitoxin system RelB/DinJ family antitoxin [Lactiplantibacillus pentosus]MB